MMGERPPPDPPRFGSTMNVGSSTGWTDEKHMSYITSLEESFVNQLYNGEVDKKGSFRQSPEVWHKTSYNGNDSNSKLDQGYWETLETDGAESRSSPMEYFGSLSCSGFQDNSIASYMDSDTSTNCPQERTSNPARLKNSGRFTASYLRWNGHSLRTESSGQNFVDGETEEVRMNTAEGAGRSDRNRKPDLQHPREKVRDQSDGPCKVPRSMAS